MYFKRKVVLLDSPMPAAGGDSCGVDAVPRMKNKSEIEVAAPSMMRKAAGKIECGDIGAVSENLTDSQRLEKYITEDDCTNLRIELELCSDSKHFIDRL